jgi:cobyric acid synthase
MPTDLVREDGLVDGKPASDVLDMLIIPGGSLVESQTVTDHLVREIVNMANADKFVLGICSGFQILSKGTDIGRLSAIPIIREGLGLIDAEFKPLICTDQVKATVVGESFLTGEVGAEVTGFHCHTYGNVVLHKEAKPILVSHSKRLDYHKNVQDIVSGIANKEGNVVGVTLHALLDQNPVIIQGITKSLSITPEELGEIRAANAKLLTEMKAEVGIATNIRSETAPTQKTKTPRILMITAMGSGSGKTFIVTGLAGALKKRGFNVGVVKVGGDIRDSVPALYLIKEPIRGYSSIRIGESGWKPLSEALNEAGKDYDFLLIEGAMSAFTGLLNDKAERPSSTAEVAAALGAPTIVVVASDKEGVEGALVNALNFVNLTKNLGVKTAGVILNKVRTSYLNDEIQQVMKQAFEKAGVELIGIVPRIELEGRGTIPEVEIRYEEFGAKAIEIAERCMDLDRVAALAAPVRRTQLDYGAFVERFKNSLITDFGFSASKRGREEKCS